MTAISFFHHHFSWKKLLSMNHVVLGFFSIWYCKLVYWDAAEACYVIPCYEGRGLQELWKVNKGITFMGESSGVFAVFHAALGYALFSGSQQPDESLLQQAHFVVGIFSGCTFCASILSLNMVYVWSAETNILLNLSKLKVTNDVFEESGRHMIVNHKLTNKFLILSYISSIMCFFQLLVLIQLVLSQKEFTRHFRLLVSGSSGSGEAIGLLSQNSNSNSNSGEALPFQLQRPDLYTEKDEQQQQTAAVTGAAGSSSSSKWSSHRYTSNNNTTTLLV